MKTRILILSALFITLQLLYTSCSDNDDDDDDDIKKKEIVEGDRDDGAVKLNIQLSGSLQNPAFSPDGDAIVFTRFREGYNEGAADIFVFYLDTETLDTLVMDGSTNVNLPGASWNAINESIVFSSSRDPHDEIFIIDDAGNPGDEEQVTSREEYMAYEPSFSPDGEWIVFETYPLDIEDQGVVTTYKLDGSEGYIELTHASDDCRQPNWSPSTNYILYQRMQNEKWDIWLTDIEGTSHQMLTSGEGDATDASFSPDGVFVIYSSGSDVEYANIFKVSVNGGVPIQLTVYDGYDGAPSMSPDGSTIAFETYDGDPDGSAGTEIWVKDLSAK